MDCYLLFADEEWDRQILSDTSTFYQGPLQSIKKCKKAQVISQNTIMLVCTVQQRAFIKSIYLNVPFYSTLLIQGIQVLLYNSKLTFEIIHS